MKLNLRLTALCLCTLMLAPAAMRADQKVAVEKYAVGSTVATFSAQDQYEKAFKFEPGPTFLVVAFDMSSAKKANGKLNALGESFLDDNKAVYLSDIHGMPGVGRIFALPKMKKYKHRIILGDTKGLLDPFPQKEDHLTILRLDSQAKILEIQYWDPEKGDIAALLKTSDK